MASLLGSPGGSDSKESACNAGSKESSLGGEDSPLGGEKRMATDSSILVWRISRTEEPGRLQSMGSQSQTRLSDSHFHASLLSGCQFPYMALFPCLDPYSLLFCLVIYSSASEDPAQMLPFLWGASPTPSQPAPPSLQHLTWASSTEDTTLCCPWWMSPQPGWRIFPRRKGWVLALNTVPHSGVHSMNPKMVSSKRWALSVLHLGYKHNNFWWVSPHLSGSGLGEPAEGRHWPLTKESVRSVTLWPYLKIHQLK